MNAKSVKKALSDLVADLEELDVLDIVRRRLDEGEDPFQILLECQAGMQQVGERYEKGEYYVSALIMAGEILRESIEILQPKLTNRVEDGVAGAVLLGTVKTDIHDIGKNLLRDLLECHGFTVTDLGVDVPPEEFAQHLRDGEFDVVALSGLLTSAFDAMQETIAHLREALPESRKMPFVVIGGGMTDAQVCRYAGADAWATDAMMGVRICAEHMVRKS